MTDYPSTLPPPQIADYSVETVMGVDGVQFERGNSRQRRRAKRDRHVFTLNFIFTSAELWTWQSWANSFGYDWHTMNLESAWSGLAGEIAIPHSVRYISDIHVEPVSIGYVRVNVQAELDVSFVPEEAVIPSGNWYVAGSPSSVSSVSDVLIAGTPASPSTTFVIAGSPAIPAA